jgi:Na+/proline symporter
MNTLPIADLCVLFLYLAGITWLGVRMGKGIQKQSEFFMPRRFGKGMMMMHAFGTGTASDQAVVVASGTFRHGLSGIWYQWLWLFNTPFYWLIAPVFRRFRATTTADVYALRFGSSVALLFALVGIVGLAVKIGLLLKGAGALVESGTNGAVSASLAMPVVAILFVAYGMVGGLGAAIVTDYIQGILTVLFSVMLLPWTLSAVGGLSGVRDTLNDPSMLSMIAPEGVTPFFIATFAVLSLVGIVAQPFIMGVCGAGRTEMDGRFGFVVGNLIKRICTAAWAVTGIAALAWYMKQGTDITAIDPDQVYGQMAAEFLPKALPGLLGLFLASILAGVMSSCDSMMISAAGLFTENLYKPLFKNRTPHHYLLIGRGVSILIVLSGVFVAFWMTDVVKGLKFWLKIAPMLGIAFWIGLFWKRYNGVGAWISTLSGFCVWWLTLQSGVVHRIESLPFAKSLGLIEHGVNQSSIYEPWQIVIYLSAAALSGIIASLLTKKPDKAKMQQFHQLIRTPVQSGEVITTSCQLPAEVKPMERATWFTGTDFETPVPSKTSMVGFLLSWLAVGGMIGGFMWVMSF